MCPRDAGEPAMGSLYGKVQGVYVHFFKVLRINEKMTLNVQYRVIYSFQSLSELCMIQNPCRFVISLFYVPWIRLFASIYVLALKSSIPYPLLPTRERGTNIKMFRPGRVRPDLFCFSNASGDLSSESWGKPETKKPSWHEASSGCLSIFSWMLQTTSQATIKTRYAIHQAKSAQLS